MIYHQQMKGVKEMKQRELERWAYLSSVAYAKNKKGININKKIKDNLKTLPKTQELRKSVYDIIRKQEPGETVKTIDEANYLLNHRNYSTMKVGESSSCIFLKGNTCWISEREILAIQEKDEDGNVKKRYTHRYMSKNKETGEYFNLSVIDMFSILNGGNFRESVVDACTHIGLHIEEEALRMNEAKKYMHNIYTIETFEKIKDNYPSLYKLMKRNWVYLEKMVNIAQAHLFQGMEFSEENGVFFASSRYVAEFLGKTGGQTNRALNLMCVLGLLIKVIDSKDIPTKMYQRAEQEKLKNKRNYIINFYRIPELTPFLLENAEKRAAILNKEKIRTNISEEKARMALGEEISEMVWGDAARRAKGKKSKSTKQFSNAPLDTVDDYSDMPF